MDMDNKKTSIELYKKSIGEQQLAAKRNTWVGHLGETSSALSVRLKKGSNSRRVWSVGATRQSQVYTMLGQFPGANAGLQDLVGRGGSINHV